MKSFEDPLVQHCPVSIENRFIDVVDFQANSGAKDLPFIRYFTDCGKLIEVTFSEFRYAVYNTSLQFKKLLVEADPASYLNVGYLSYTSANCFVNHTGLMYLNVTPVLLSPRNSLSSICHLLVQSDSKYLIYDESLKNIASACKDKLPHLKLIPKIVLSRELMKPTPAPTPLVKNSGKNHIIAIIHSSGTTSVPKLVYLSNRYGLTLIKRVNYLRKEPPAVRNMLNLAPVFHLFGSSVLWRCYYRGSVCVFGSSASANSTQRLLDDADHSNVTSMSILPIQLKRLVEYCLEHDNEAGWKKLSKVSSLSFGGAPLPKEISSALISRGITLVNGYGSSETGLLAYTKSLHNEANIRIVALYKGVEFKLVNREKDGRCQILILASDPGLATGVVKPEQEGYLINDFIRVVKYNEQEGYLQFEVLGRMDDTIVHLSGEKTNPIPIEELITSCVFVEKCIVIGSNQNSCSLIVELNQDATSKHPIHRVTKVLYEYIDKANKQSPSHSKIDHDLIYIIPKHSKKQLPTTAKGNVIRALGAQMFKDEIDEMYTSFNTGSKITPDIEFGIVDKELDQGSIRSYIKRCFEKVMAIALKEGDSFFVQGMDSITAVKFNNLLKALYPRANISVNIVYQADNLELLAHYILEKYQGKEIQSRTLESYQKEVDGLIKEYSQYPDFNIESPKSKIKKSKLNVLITGANGSLGSFIIRALLQREDIGCIYGLARAPNNDEAMKKIKAGFSDRKINLSESQWSQVKGFAYVTDDAQLGLNEEDYNDIFNSVDIIYHVAWRMDFLKGVLAFRDCIESTVNLLKISALSPNHPAFHFTSTVGATFPVNPRLVVEEVKLTPNLVNVGACNGYNLSKLVSEILCYRWANHFGFPLDVHRVGQVSGDTINGVWNVREHISLLIKAAQVMGMIPESFMGSVSWIPVDVAANAMVEINFDANNPHTGTINHIVNPQTTPWKHVITLLQELGINCEPVTSQRFIESLEHEPKFQDVDINPLASLAGFFINILRRDKPSNINMETILTSQRAPSMKACIVVNSELLRKYLTHWDSINFIKFKPS